MKYLIDLTDGIDEVRVQLGDRFVATTPEHFLECMSWLLSSVDVDTRITSEGVEPDDFPSMSRRNAL